MGQMILVRKKTNRVCLKIFDVNRNKKVTSHFFDMCLTSGVDGATAAAIFSVIDEKFESHEIPWEDCVSLSVENTNINGRQKEFLSIKV